MVKLGSAPYKMAFFHVNVNYLFPEIIDKTVKVFCNLESRDQMDFTVDHVSVCLCGCMCEA